MKTLEPPEALDSSTRVQIENEPDRSFRLGRVLVYAAAGTGVVSVILFWTLIILYGGRQ